MTMSWVKQNSTDKRDASQDYGNMIHQMKSLGMHTTSLITFYTTSFNYVSWFFCTKQHISKHVSSCSDIFIKSNLYNTSGLYFVSKIFLSFNIY